VTGQGVWADLLHQRFARACARLGLERLRIEFDLSGFRLPPADDTQGQLFRDRSDPGGRHAGHVLALACRRSLEQVLDLVGPALAVG